MRLITLNKEDKKKMERESKSWEIIKYDEVGKCTSRELGSISGKEFEKVARERNFYNEDNGTYRLSLRNKSIRVFTGEGRSLDDVIESDADFRRMSRIMNNLNNMNQVMISSSTKRAAIPANKKSLVAFTKLSEKKNIEFYNRMKKLDILREDANGNIFVSPVFCMTTTGISVELYMLFKKELDAVLPEAAIRDLQTLAYYNLHPEELVADMEKFETLDVEDVLAEARKEEVLTDIEIIENALGVDTLKPKEILEDNTARFNEDIPDENYLDELY